MLCAIKPNQKLLRQQGIATPTSISLDIVFLHLYLPVKKHVLVCLSNSLVVLPSLTISYRAKSKDREI